MKCQQPKVSIHAPTRGATWQRYVSNISRRVSIHAPTRGATPSKVSILVTRVVSIHAPTRGATKGDINEYPRVMFQSTRLREARLCVPSVQLDVGVFQSTRLREARLLCRYPYIVLNYVSIHAPTRGATQNTIAEDRW